MIPALTRVFVGIIAVMMVAGCGVATLPTIPSQQAPLPTWTAGPPAPTATARPTRQTRTPLPPGAPTRTPRPTQAPLATVTPATVGQLPETYALKDVSITLERTACFGTCPIYTVTVQGDGTVNYVGEKFVKVEGTQTRQISREALIELLRLFYTSDFFSFRDEYLEGRDINVEADGTVQQVNVSVTDLPTTIVTLQVASSIKSVRAYYLAPDALYTIATKIDETAGTAEWVKTP